MYEVFDLNGKSVFKIEPANGMIGYLYHGIATVESVKVGDKRKLVRDGAITCVRRDTDNTFMVELGIDSENGSQNMVRQHCTSNIHESRLTVYGKDTEGCNKRAFDLVSVNGSCFIETKDNHGRKICTPANIIGKAVGCLFNNGDI